MRKIILIVLLFVSTLSFAQNDSCTNIGFEYGDCSGWDVITGTVPANPTAPCSFNQNGTSSCNISVNHMLMTGGNDTVVRPQILSVVFPEGGISLRLGDVLNSGNGAARIKQTFLVDSIDNVFMYQYAVVLNNCSHSKNDRPYFKVLIYKDNGDTIHFFKVDSLHHSGTIFYSNPFGGGFGVFLPWSNNIVNLSDYVGENVTVEFTTGDCAKNTHYGYAYIDATCFTSGDCSFFDLEASLSADAFGVGQPSRINIEVFDRYCADTSGLVLVLDSMMSFISSEPIPDNISGNILTWNALPMNYDTDSFPFYVDVLTNADLSIGDTLCMDISVLPMIGDVDTTNNIKKYCFPVEHYYFQNDSCINMGFENGDFQGWNLFTGQIDQTFPYGLINIDRVSPPSTQHVVYSTGIDAQTGLSRVFPDSGIYSVMIGDETGVGSFASKITQTFEVDSLNSVFGYHYAVVLSDAGHDVSQNPFFKIQIHNQIGDTIHLKEVRYQPVTSGGDPDFIPYTGGFYLPWRTEYVNLSAYVGQSVSVEFTTGDCSESAHYGYAYVDADCLIPANCMFFDLSLTDVNFIECDSAGYISTFVENGALPYTYQWSSGETTSEIFPTIPGIYDLTVTDSVGCVLTKSVLINGPNYAQFDLNVNISANVFRAGRNTRIDLNTFNDGCIDTSGQLTLVLDDLVSYNHAFPVPDVINGDTLIWNTPLLNYDSTHFIPYVYVYTNSGANAGDTLCFDVSIIPIFGDADTTNNQKQYCYTVLNSYDPNYKEVYPKGECFENYVLDNQELTYTVHFQNTGTAPAIDIFIMDTLNANLDINTVRIVGQSHDNLVTEVVNGNTLKFIFDNINLPDSSTDEAASHGSVVFTVQPITTIASPSRVENSVGIYFDFNEPIITNTVFNTFIDTIPHTETILTETAITSYDLNGTIYDSTGTYYQYLSSVDGCDSTIVLNLTITTTGLDALNAGKDVMIYPNPIRNELKISVPNTLVNYQVEVISITGQPMFKGNNTSKINTTSFAQGIYFVKVWNDKQVVIKKVIKE